MRAIKQRFFVLVVVSSLGILTSLFLIFKKDIVNYPFSIFVSIIIILITACLLIIMLRSYANYKTVLLITENQLLYIQAIKIEKDSQDETFSTIPIGGIEIIISCFGILLGSQVIKFNLDGTKLKSVELGQQFISLSFGTDDRTQRIRILHDLIEKKELQRLAKRMRYETGVIPVVTDL